MAFYDVFEQLCNERGVSPTQVARDNGLTQQTVSHWKTRSSTPKAETVQRLADYFGVSMAYLLDNSPIIFTVSTEELKKDLKHRIQKRNSPRIFVNATLDQMTLEGQRKVADYAEDILPRYRRQEPAEAPPASPNGTDTTPPPEGSEGPQEGE